ncbi:MAG: thiosulfate transporter subunit [Nevskia sp.]|nr:thiosulfate transporter subunit [Nevskia sp.]
MLFAGQVGAAQLLNASYDVARGFYKDLNPAFIADWKKHGGADLSIDQSHGGSSKQARSVIDGLEADVVTMNNPLDIDAIAKAGLLPADWQKRLPNNSSPSWSAILFIVRKGNPKGIKDWDDLVKSGVQVIVPNPKTSGNGRYSYLAAWQYARSKTGGSDDTAIAFEKKLFGNVPVLDTGGRGATTTFAQRGIGDVLLTFENEVGLIRDEFGADKFEIVVPSLTVRADNPIALVDKVAAKKGTTPIAQAYLQFHYTKAAQEIFAKNGLRPIDAAVLKAHAADFPALNLFDVEQAFGGWSKAQADHFADGGSFDKIIANAHP